MAKKQELYLGLLLLFAAFLIIIGIGDYYCQCFPKRVITKAVAIVYPTKGNKVQGTVVFTQESHGVRVVAHLTGLPTGEHGFHIHEFGNCMCDDAKCAGDHFNPTHRVHGGPASTERHIGDLGNVHADKDGIGTYDIIDTHIALHGVHSIVGRAVIIHENPDDFVSQPSGNAGARIGAGVIGIAEEILKH